MSIYVAEYRYLVILLENLKHGKEEKENNQNSEFGFTGGRY